MGAWFVVSLLTPKHCAFILAKAPAASLAASSDISVLISALVLQDAAVVCMNESCSVVGNIDIEPFVPSLISCIPRPEEVPECVHGLAATTFVQVKDLIITAKIIYCWSERPRGFPVLSLGFHWLT